MSKYRKFIESKGLSIVFSILLLAGLFFSHYLDLYYYFGIVFVVIIILYLVTFIMNALLSKKSKYAVVLTKDFNISYQDALSIISVKIDGDLNKESIKELINKMKEEGYEQKL